MRISDIQNSSLQQWVSSYTERTLSEAKSKRISPSAYNDLWRSYTELDWHALRSLQDLRPAARNRFSPDEIEVAIQKKLRSTPRLWRGKDVYDAPWSLSVEAHALQELLGIRPPETSVEALL